jgi:DNA-binding NtrC family response regulator
VIILDYHKIEMDLLCGIIDALPQPTALLNREAQVAYTNLSGAEHGLSDFDFAENESVVTVLADGVRKHGELIAVGDMPGTARIFPVYQGKEIAGALFFFEPIVIEKEDFPAQLPYVSTGIQDVVTRIARLSGVNASVLFVGEIGVGKESFARLLHSQSQRNALPFKTVDCRPGAGEMETLFSDSDLCQEYANAGMLFFDSIDALDPVGQDALFGIVQSKKLGDYDVTARLSFSATPELRTMAQTGKFSYDLFQRVSLMNIFVPPIRDRTDDIPPLVRFYLAKFNKLYGKSIKDFSEDYWRYLLRHEWTQNLRDMEIIIKESVADCTGEIVEYVPLAAGRQVSLRRDRHKYNYTRIEALLSVYGNTTEGKRRAAKELGIGLSSLYRIVANYKRDKSWGKVD